jgi:hypothetical protein
MRTLPLSVFHSDDHAGVFWHPGTADLTLERARPSEQFYTRRACAFVCCAFGGGNFAVTEYKITVARIETDARDAQDKEICVTFQVERVPISFQIPIFLNPHDFDDTEMIQVARNILHRIFMQLAAESREWKLTTAGMQRLSKLNLRPTKRPA